MKAINAKGKVVAFITAFLYAAVYDFIVRAYLFEEFGYMLRYEYHPMDTTTYFAFLFICAFPVLFFKGLKYLASVFSFFCFVLVYIPFLHTLFVAGYPFYLRIQFILLFFILQVLFFKTDSISLRLLKPTNLIKYSTFEKIVYLLLFIVLLLSYNKMHFVNIFSIDDASLLYDYREQNQNSTEILVSYLTQWLNNILLPIILIGALQKKSLIKVLLSFLGMLLVFAIDMQKISFVMPFVITLCFYLYRLFSDRFVRYFHIGFMGILMIIPTMIIMIPNKILSSIGFLLIMRTQCIEGKQFAAYFDFFELHNNPYTYYTHINIINKLTGAYPYQESLGYTVAYGEGNSNATFFLMDGIAACGYWGCIIAAIIFILIKSCFNVMTDKYDRGLLCILLLFPLANLVNVSIFTSLLSGGIILLYIVAMKINLNLNNN